MPKYPCCGSDRIVSHGRMDKAPPCSASIAIASPVLWPCALPTTLLLQRYFHRVVMNTHVVVRGAQPTVHEQQSRRPGRRGPAVDERKLSALG